MNKRRNLLKGLSVIGTTGAVKYWETPVVKSVILPAHAQATCNGKDFSESCSLNPLIPNLQQVALVECSSPLGTNVITRSYIDESGDCPVLADFVPGECHEGFVYYTRHARDNSVDDAHTFYLGVIAEKLDSSGNVVQGERLFAEIDYDQSTGLAIPPELGGPVDFGPVNDGCPYPNSLGGFGTGSGSFDTFTVRGSAGGVYEVGHLGTGLTFVNPLNVEMRGLSFEPVLP